jgi:hypothetical protein
MHDFYIALVGNHTVKLIAKDIFSLIDWIKGGISKDIPLTDSEKNQFITKMCDALHSLPVDITDMLSYVKYADIIIPEFNKSEISNLQAYYLTKVEKI